MAATVGHRTLLKSSYSSVTIEVAERVKSVIMQHVHTDFDSIRKSVPNKECLISPVIHLHTKDTCEQDELIEYKYKVMIPQCLTTGLSLSSVKERTGSIKRRSLTEITKCDPQDRSIPYYEVSPEFIRLYSNHFCDVVCTSTEKVCTTKVMAIPFGLIGKQESGTNVITQMKMKTYMCSYLYSDNALQEVSVYFIHLFQPMVVMPRMQTIFFFIICRNWGLKLQLLAINVGWIDHSILISWSRCREEWSFHLSYSYWTSSLDQKWNPLNREMVLVGFD